MATLYTQVSSNVFKTWSLLFFFALFIIGVGWLFSYQLGDPSILYIAVAIAVFQSFFSYWFSDKVVLAMAGAKLIEKRDNPELYRIVENLCIASGLPLPKIYIINEAQPNAFATGRDKNHAVVAVTAGLLQRLDKQELEGVIAHELSHIGNRDILLQTVVVISVGIIAILSDFFLRISFWGGGRRDDDRDRGQLGLILGVLAIVAAILAPIAATLIQLAISRKREFLADADAALLTRYPEGLARALQKIASDPNPLRGANDSTAHLYIANPFRGKQAKSWFTGLFSTHPPIEERIKILMEMSV
ncbi:MAG: M48 family metallopeptidase [Candidatus Pacebacteria bacterium]|jgi:heat shock protein HtpX|nr:M48 family metallopeptidase [Candidatus Paceibacterota bacterium]